MHGNRKCKNAHNYRTLQIISARLRGRPPVFSAEGGERGLLFYRSLRLRYRSPGLFDRVLFSFTVIRFKKTTFKNKKASIYKTFSCKNALYRKKVLVF